MNEPLISELKNVLEVAPVEEMAKLLPKGVVIKRSSIPNPVNVVEDLSGTNTKVAMDRSQNLLKQFRDSTGESYIGQYFDLEGIYKNLGFEADIDYIEGMLTVYLEQSKGRDKITTEDVARLLTDLESSLAIGEENRFARLESVKTYLKNYEELLRRRNSNEARY